MQNSKLLIVDGSNLLFQMFYGMPSRIIGRNGKPIQGTLGFIGALLKTIRKVTPTHVIVVFDGEHPNDRIKIDSEYKANRVDYSEITEEETPFSQLNDICIALNYLNIKYVETIDCEADDLIASYTSAYENLSEIIIMSFDSDFFQLINERVSILRYRGEKSYMCDLEYFMIKFGIHPKQYIDFKSLVGDSSDNIKGVHGIGPKTAGKLLHEYGSIDGILCNIKDIKKNSIKSALLEKKEKLKVNQELIKMNVNKEIPVNLSRLKYEDKKQTTIDVLFAIGLK